ncbi:MAG: hypothetical protein ACKVK3_02275 [Acidimicrobiales bacterium]
MVQSRLGLLICLAVAAVFLAACSSTTGLSIDEPPVVASTAGPAAASTTDSSQANTEPDDTDTADGSRSDTQNDSDPADNTASDNSASDNTDADAETDQGASTDAPATTPEVEIPKGFGLGGSEQLQGLLTDCADGNNLACDILYVISPFNSTEEAVAVTCGGLANTAVTFCTAGIDAGEDERFFALDSAGLGRVTKACQVGGDMTACDFLYYRSPIGSQLEEIGSTCGGRINVALPDCRSTIAE